MVKKLVPVTALSNVIGQPMASIRQGTDDPIVAPESKIIVIVLGWVEVWVVRSDSLAVGVAELFSQCAFAWIAW